MTMNAYTYIIKAQGEFSVPPLLDRLCPLMVMSSMSFSDITGQRSMLTKVN